MMSNIMKSFLRKLMGLALLAVLVWLLWCFVMSLWHDFWETSLTAIAVVLIIALLSILTSSYKRRKMRKRFTGRVAISLSKQLATLADEVDVVAAEKLWREIAAILPGKILAEELRLDDHIERELAAVPCLEVDSHVDDIGYMLLHEADKGKLDVDLAKMYTLADVLQAFCGRKIVETENTEPPSVGS